MKKTTVRNLVILGISFLGLNGLYHLAKERKHKSIEVRKEKEENPLEVPMSTNYITVYQKAVKPKEQPKSKMYDKIEEVEIEEQNYSSTSNNKYYILKFFPKKNSK